MSNFSKITSRTLLFLSILGLSACNQTSTQTSTSDPSTSDVITGINAIVPETLTVGETRTVAVDILGSNDDSALFSSSDTSVLTVSDSGLLTAVAVGQSTLTITAKNDTSVSSTYSINVIGVTATGIDLIVPESIEFDSERQAYLLPLGSTTDFDYKLLGNNVSEADYNIAFSLIATSTSDQSISSLELNVSTGELYASTATSSGTLTLRVSASYRTSDQTVSDDINFVVVDENANLLSELEAKLSAANTYEGSSLISARRELTYTSDSGTAHDNSSYYSYTNNNYTVKSVMGAGESTYTQTYLYSGVQSRNGVATDYVFEYTPNQTSDNAVIDDIIVSQTSTDSSIYKNHVVDSIGGGSNHYGIASGLSTRYLSNSSLSGNFLALGDTEIYAHASINSSTDSGASTYVIESSYEDDSSGWVYDLDFTFIFDANGGLTSFVANETISSDNSTLYTYKEEVKNIVYGTRSEVPTTATFYFDFNNFYYTSLSISALYGTTDPAGRFDYSNEEKFSPEAVESEEYNGQTIAVYTMRVDKTLPLQIVDRNNSSANANIDTIIATSSDSTVVSAPTSTFDGIFTISPNEVEGSKVTGETYITFSPKSNSSLSVTIKVIFIEGTINRVYLTGNSSFESGEAEVLYEGQYGGSFYVNTAPVDYGEAEFEATNPYRLVITSGTAGGIELYKNETGNIDGKYGYSIHAVTPGEYTFKIQVNIGTNEAEVWTDIEFSTEYKVSVLTGFTPEFINSSLSGKTFINGSKTNGNYIALTFDGTNMNFSYHTYSADPISETVPYTAGTHSITTSGYTFGESFAYDTLREGIVGFNSEFTVITLYLGTTDETTAITHYAPYQFTLEVDENNLASVILGNTYTYGASKYSILASRGQDFLFRFNLTFDSSTSATMEIWKNYDESTGKANELYETLTISYSLSGTSFIINSISTSQIISSSGVSITFLSEYNGESNLLRFRFTDVSNSESSQVDLYFSLLG